MTDLDALVLARLEGGRWHLIDGLAHELDVPRRAIEDSVERLRLEYHPIIGGNTGLRLSDSSSEVRAYAQDRRRRLVSIAKGTRALLATARRMDGPQTVLWRDHAA